MTSTSPLVQKAIIATANEMDSDVELFGVPVDLPGRAVVFVTAPVRLVIKVDNDPTRLLREQPALEILTDVVPVAKMWFHVAPETPDDPQEPWILATSYLDGDRISHKTSRSGWSDLGRQLGKLHDVRPDERLSTHPSNPSSVNKWATQLARSAHDAGVIDEKIATAFLGQTIAETPSDRTARLIHGELTPDHVFVERDRVSGLIDLGDCGVGDPAYDLATVTLWNRDKLEFVLEGYGEVVDRSALGTTIERDIERFQLIRLLAGALWLQKYEFTTTPYVGELYERLLAGLTDR